ncbi:hypothetical protein GCM10022419_088300 [Nonomuraea rosea]|uniref:ATP-binding protein n=1 Tax=Nonomuraea rosea TaxID=638574 RepID=A0ABP6YUX3_9ACTN
MYWLNELTDPSDPRTRLVTDLLTRRVYGRSVEDLLLTAGLNPGHYVLEPAKLAWRAVVPDAASLGLLSGLVGEVVRQDPAFGALLESRLRELTTPPGAARRWYHHDDPYACQFLGPRASRALIDRVELRKGLRALVHDDFRILVVNGPEGSGKSHTWVLVDHLRDAGTLAGTHRFARVTTHAWSDTVTGEDLGLSMARKLGLDIALASSGEQAATIVRKILDMLVGKYPQGDGVTRWIILDGLDRPGVDDSARDLAKSLIRLVDEGELPYTRLIVTGLDTLGLQIGSSVRHETIPAITVALVRAFLADAARHLGHEADDQELDALAAEALGPGEGPPDLRSLEENVYRIVTTHWVKEGGGT